MARGLGAHLGAFDASAAQDVQDGDAFQALPTVLSGAADVINPHKSGNYIINTAGVDAITLGLPTVGADDNLSIAIYSATTNAHTITLPSAQLAPGVALKTTAALAAFAGAGILLRAWNGTWQVVGSAGTVTYS